MIDSPRAGPTAMGTSVVQSETPWRPGSPASHGRVHRPQPAAVTFPRDVDAMPRPNPACAAFDPHERIRALPCWRSSPREIKELVGGITNKAYLVDDGERHVVRLGQDIPSQHVMRFNEHAASLTAAELGISPQVRHVEADVLVIDYIPSITLRPEQVGEHLPGILELMRRVHREMSLRIRGPVLAYWIFHVIRDTIATLRGHSVEADLRSLLEQAGQLEAAVGPIELTFCHNDWLAANILADERRLWLIDWDYAGFNSPLSDLGSLASNNLLDPTQERWLLENYFEQPLQSTRHRQYLAMKAASLLKESLWSMNSEVGSSVDFDFRGYSATCLERYAQAWADFQQA